MRRDGRVAGAERELRRMVRDLITEGQKSDDVRRDVTPDELVSYCLHALTAPGGRSSTGGEPPARRGHSGWVAPRA